jgi:hypothetical protein
MITLAVDRNDSVWGAVEAAIDRRRTDLLADILALSATDDARRNAVARYDELGLLLEAPGDTLRATQAKHDAADARVRVY